MRTSKLLHRILKFINYANLCKFKINEKCYFSVISWPILILFVLSDRAWWGLRNFYTELWNSLIMQIYANLIKINLKNATSPLFRNHNRSALEAGTYITHHVIYYPLVNVKLWKWQVYDYKETTECYIFKIYTHTDKYRPTVWACIILIKLRSIVKSLYNYDHCSKYDDIRTSRVLSSV